MRILERMKSRWGVGIWGAVAILLSFSLAGMTVLRLKRPILTMILPPDPPAWMSWLSYLIIVFPLYQITLLGYGTLLGQFRFFWRKEKSMGRWLLRLFTGRKAR